LVAALGTLARISEDASLHAVVGIAFVSFVAIHLVQRRNTIAGMASRLVHARSFSGYHLRRAVADALLACITLSVLMSGIIDWGSAIRPWLRTTTSVFPVERQKDICCAGKRTTGDSGCLGVREVRDEPDEPWRPVILGWILG
jgi:hypothetical protein